jgi:hypothetical protein
MENSKWKMENGSARFSEMRKLRSSEGAQAPKLQRSDSIKNVKWQLTFF